MISRKKHHRVSILVKELKPLPLELIVVTHEPLGVYDDVLTMRRKVKIHSQSHCSNRGLVILKRRMQGISYLELKWDSFFLQKLVEVQFQSRIKLDSVLDMFLDLLQSTLSSFVEPIWASANSIIAAPIVES